MEQFCPGPRRHPAPRAGHRASCPTPTPPRPPPTRAHRALSPSGTSTTRSPPELIAQHPAAERSASRLLDARGTPFVDRIFHDLPSLLDPGDLLVFNDTRVIKARLHGRKDSGGSVEGLIERILSTADGSPAREVWAHLRASKSPRAGQTVRFAEAFDAEVLGRCGPEDSLFHLRFPSDAYALLEAHGHVPLPPYITHADDEDDVRRYQTVFAARPGAVAAPTALAALRRSRCWQRWRHAACSAPTSRCTWAPAPSSRCASSSSASTACTANASRCPTPPWTRSCVPARQAGAWWRWAPPRCAHWSPAPAAVSCAPGAAETDLFITPGFPFRVVDRLVTNFHLPRSTLLMLVSALAGHERIRAAYAHAITAGYRFFSYGDAMLLDRH